MLRLHRWAGAILAAYVVVMSATGSAIVFRTDLVKRFLIVDWLVDLHVNLLSGSTGYLVNGFAAVALAIVAVTGAISWWPGIGGWHRSLAVDQSPRSGGLLRSLHRTGGFWFIAFVAIWALSGIYFAFPETFAWLPSAPLRWLARLHAGRINRLTQCVWVAAGLAPAALAVSGVVMWWRRVVTSRCF
jgi:uncharacterized iron-regulated membrane protein